MRKWLLLLLVLCVGLVSGADWDVTNYTKLNFFNNTNSDNSIVQINATHYLNFYHHRNFDFRF